MINYSTSAHWALLMNEAVKYSDDRSCPVKYTEKYRSASKNSVSYYDKL